jgi:5-methylcytosine-specific restriction endonuclease McrA|tara:strand:- start:18173 stop:18607 length:435 start_codon:yes stop_codon:yes gene_type:complete
MISLSKVDTFKKCEQCGKDYVAHSQNISIQKYCSTSCKDKSQYYRAKNSGHIRAKKSGYPRKLSIKLYMLARNSDITAPCHYCKKRLMPDNFQLDHKVPMSKGGFTTKAEIQEESNLVVCCDACNREKGNEYTYDQFIKMKQNG